MLIAKLHQQTFITEASSSTLDVLSVFRREKCILGKLSNVKTLLRVYLFCVKIVIYHVLTLSSGGYGFEIGKQHWSSHFIYNSLDVSHYSNSSGS